jgi:hypothetical protein
MQTSAKRPNLLNKCAGLFKFPAGDKRSDHLRKGKIGHFQRFADIGGAE